MLLFRALKLVLSLHYTWTTQFIFSCYPYSLHLMPAFVNCNKWHTSFLQTLQKPESASIEEGGTSGTANVNESSFNISAQIRGKRALDDAVAVSELERLMEGKTFSRYVIYYHICSLDAFQMMLETCFLLLVIFLKLIVVSRSLDSFWVGAHLSWFIVYPSLQLGLYYFYVDDFYTDIF